MTKKLVLIAAASLLVASVASAEVCNPTRSQNQLAWLFDLNLGSPAFADGATANADSVNTVAATADGGAEGAPEYDAFCEATCESGTVSCSGNSCSAVNRNCNFGQQGYVVCDGNYTYCPTTCPPPTCTMFQCRQGCSTPGCFAYCVDLETCECDVICP